ncbi:hypothetical protein FXO38_19658 [Capsicum annuum]|nr:hypothetical protein FXO38_19658 [Capsicum annuum]
MSNLTKASTNQKPSNLDLVLLLKSSEEASSHSIQSTMSEKCTVSSFLSSSNKRRSSPLKSLPPEDMHKFWSLTHKEKFLSFMNRPIISGRIVNFSLLKESHCNIGHFLKAQDLLTMLRLCGLEVFDDPTHKFFAYLCHSPDSGELETLVLGTRIILNDFLFEKVFAVKFSSIVHFRNESWPENFEICEHMVESAPDSHFSVSLPYGLLITQILIYYGIDLSAYPVVKVSIAYDSKTFTSMGYVLIEKEWCKKESIKN